MVASPRSTPPGDDDLDDATLVARAQDGDLVAFETLVTRWESRLYRYAYSMLGNRVDAEDALQDTFIRAWRFLPGLTAPEAFTTWIYRTLTRQCFDRLHRRHRQSDALPPADLAALAERGPAPLSAVFDDPAKVALSRHRLDALARLVDQLPADQRACWLMREVHGHSYAEIAAVLGVGESTVRGRLARARKDLSEGMTSWR